MIKRTLTLRFLIVGLILICIMTLFFGAIFVFRQLNRQYVINDTLKINRVYADKLADTTDFLFGMMHQNLEAQASEITKFLGEKNKLRAALDLNLSSSRFFNSLLVVSKEGEILVSSPNQNVEGIMLNTVGSQQAIKEKRFLISAPYIATTGRLLILISQPIWDDDGNYMGFIGGTIYLQEASVLQNVLGNHFYQDGSYLYVVDQRGRIIYHPDKDRIGDVSLNNLVINEVMHAHEGSTRVVNSQGVEMLAGYAYINSSRWGIISQTPLKQALEPNDNIIRKVILYALPILLATILLSLYLSNKIAMPLRTLANISRKLIDKEEENIAFPKNQSWYYEADYLNKAMVHMFEVLQHRANIFKNESLTDPLTGLMNRRAMDIIIRQYVEKNKQFAVALVDIDRFKNVNDIFGHQVGDAVLQYAGKMLKDTVRREDLCCRYGGEELMVLLPSTDDQGAFSIMEKYRKKLSETISPSGENITISCGISSFPHHAASAEDVIRLADQALYKAKSEGRNNIIVNT
ncbi:sensor domain-containing diguanylate cyclase [Paenibacillus sp. sgz302251]|uniref:sensor domain-containing diguanylate cyclase n=1 Tax=Paenibacillus sp. sgz302251 TaxID=3414493 RepID=UPI003C7E6219